MKDKKFKYGTDRLTIGLAWGLTQGDVEGTLCEETRDLIQQSASHVQEIVESQDVVYGINTGFGPLCDTIISSEDTSTLQHNLLMSHAVGVGKPIEKEIAKTMLIIKVQALAQGYSGVRMETVERICWMIAEDM